MKQTTCHTEDVSADDHYHEPRSESQVDLQAIERAAAIFRCAGDPGRLRILARLTEGEFCVTELATEMGENMSTISQRLRHLRAQRLVRTWRDGKHIYYSLADEHVGELVRAALDHAAEHP